MAWNEGEVIVHREIWRGTPWCAMPTIVVEDTPGLFVSYVPEEAPFAFPPSADGRSHPWSEKRCWRGHGMLALRRPGEAYSVMHFWKGSDRRFAGWYLNLEEPFRRTATGYDTQDLELDVWIPVDGEWQLKDEQLVEQRVREGRYDEDQAAAIHALGRQLVDMLDLGERWWDERWMSFEPDPAWRAPAFPTGWEATAVAEAPAPGDLRVTR